MKLWPTCSIALLLFVSSALSAQQHVPISYLIVVGTFRIDQNAKAYCQTVLAKGYDARVVKDSVSGLNYVYVGTESDRQRAIERVEFLRQGKGFEDAWGKLETISPIEQPEALTKTPTQETQFVAAAQPTQMPTHFEVSNTEIFLLLYNASNDKLIDGKVEVIDTERGRLIDKANGNDYYVLPDPKSTSKRISLIADVFGYRRMQTEISYPVAPADSLSSNFEMIGTIVMIRFDMVRYAKGDINVLYNVYFFNDAAVMQPESRYELNNLLDMMLENPNYRIRLHGHSNGNYTGKIYEPADKDHLFSLAGSLQSFGSAKELSYKRASVIKDYLVQNGIDEKRIELKSWAGRKPLYDKNSANAKKNVRVEVEIIAQ